MRPRSALSIGLAVLAIGAANGKPAVLTHGDVRWLGRVTFGVDSSVVASYRQLGREKFLDSQLHPPKDDPGDLHAAIAALVVSQKTAEARIFEIRRENQRINALTSDDEKQKARMALGQA